MKFSTLLLGLLCVCSVKADDKSWQITSKASEQFASKLYAQLSKKSGNFAFSPFSLHAVLSMLYQGAAPGKTYETFQKGLHIPEAEIAAKGYKDLIDRLNSAKDVELDIANKIYIDKKYHLNPGFTEAIQKNFYSDIENVNFKDRKETTVKAINDWVYKKTGEKVKDIIETNDIKDDTHSFIVNTLFFNGKWQTPFDTKYTRTDLFYLNEEEKINVTMMKMSFGRLYTKQDHNLKARIIEFPFTNDKFKMILVLPNEKEELRNVEKKIIEYNLTKLMENLTNDRFTVVKLPKFKIESTFDLEDQLRALDFGHIFETPDFSNLSTEDGKQLTVGKVVQKVFLEVNEQGTVASSASGVLLFLRGGRVSYPVYVVNRPFLIILAEKIGGTVTPLFYARIVKPE